MLEVRRHLDLGEEPLGTKHSAELGVQNLERDFAVVPDVAREVDRCHAARADLTVNGVTAFECGAEAGLHEGLLTYDPR